MQLCSPREAQTSYAICINQNQSPLSQTQNGSVFWCRNCKRFSVAFGTSCLLFEEHDFNPFIHLLLSLDKEDYKYQFSADMQVLLKNNQSTVGLCLSRREVDELVQLMTEAKLIHQAMQLIISDN